MRRTETAGMEQLPNWLVAAIAAAGMTAYADDLDPKVSKDQMADVASPESVPPLH
jgi:hypothetical protein